MKSNKLKSIAILLFVCTVFLAMNNEKSFGQIIEKWFVAGSHPQDYEMGGDPTVSHGSENAGFIRSKVSQIDEFGTWMTNIEPNMYPGKRLQMTAYIKATDVENWAGLWMRVDGPDKKMLSFDNMQNRAIKGTKDWNKYAVVLDVPENSIKIAIGILLSGKGDLWIDDLKLEIVSEDIPITSHNYGSNEKVGKYATVNDIKMYYEIYGQGNPLVLIHGNGGSINLLGHQIGYFSEHYKVIAADSRGHGKTDIGKEKLTYEQMAEDWACLLEQLGIDSTCVIGWSDGGIIGLLLAIHHAPKVRMLAAMGANLWPDSSAIYPWLINWVKNRNQMIDNMISRNDTTQNWKLLKQHLDLVEKQPNISLTDLYKISVPVLVLAGDKDEIREEHTVLIYQNIPKAQLCIFPGGTHMIPYTNPDIFNQTVHRFFKNPFKRPDTKDFFK